MKTALYRHFDSSGVLLYVGISLNAVARLAQHAQAAGWFSKIANVEIEWFESRPDALAAEAIAIAAEGPSWNVVRPATNGHVERVISEPWDHNEVELRGEALDRIVWQGKQWAVTDYGIEARDGTYVIEKSRLFESWPNHSWARHLEEKSWVDIDDFCVAFDVACWFHRGERVRSAETIRGGRRAA